MAMPALGLFPLGIVLFPTEQIPLHIFELRYRELIDECLENEQPFGLVLADEEAGIRDVGTLAHILDIERLEDGRMNIVVEGRDRFEVTELTDERSFHTAEAGSYDDEDDPAGHALVERGLSLFARLVDLTEAEVETPDAGHPQLSYALAARFELAAEIKQPLLEERSERQRLEQVCDILEAAHAAIERQREIIRRAQTNGRH
jgi:ATP-dependent Lon protease